MQDATPLTWKGVGIYKLKMKKGETIFQKWSFGFVFLFQVLVPPLWSLKRVEPVCRKWLAQNPNACTPRRALALLYFMNRQYEDARREFSYLQELGYLTNRSKVDFAEALYNLNKHQEVVELLLSMNENYPMGYRANQYLGKSYMRMGMYEKALVYLEQLKNNRKLKLKYEDYWDLGYCYSELQHFEEALETYTRALMLKPNTPKLRENVAYVHCQRGKVFLETDVARAEEEFTRALQFWPNSQSALDGLTRIQGMRQGSV